MLIDWYMMLLLTKENSMSLIDTIKTDQVTARKNREEIKSSLLTTLLGEANMVAKNAGRDKPTDEEVQAVVKKFLKGNLETQAAINKMRPTEPALDKIGNAIKEQAILESYLPRQLGEQELTMIVANAIASNEVEKNMGKLMAYLKAKFNGEYDGKLASAVIKAQLG
jgi:uncharacterized protein YqeY